MSKNAVVLLLAGFVILVSCICVSGCTSAQNAQEAVQTTPAVTATPTQTAIPATSPAVTPVTSAPATIPATAVSVTATPATAVVGVTLNSAAKKTQLGTFKPKSGNNFLVLDLTLKNNDKNDDFEYTDASFAIFDKTVSPPHKLSPITGQVAGALENPFTSGMVPVKSEKTGQIVFPVKENSVSYKFTLYDAKGTEITSIDNISV